MDRHGRSRSARCPGKVVKVEIDIEKGRKFWAFQPVQKPAVPAVKDAAWPKSDIDRFLLAALEAKGLKPVADADPRTLIRRVTFDLIGLPPTPEEVEAFVKDYEAKPQTALETLVDRLLGSPQFGERWGRHWLDVARFAESSGRSVNFAYPHAWRYRDYVIAALQRRQAVRPVHQRTTRRRPALRQGRRAEGGVPRSPPASSPSARRRTTSATASSSRWTWSTSRSTPRSRPSRR